MGQPNKIPRRDTEYVFMGDINFINSSRKNWNGLNYTALMFGT